MREPDFGLTSLHEARLDAVRRHLLVEGARTVLDLGCGPGELIAQLVPERQFERIVGIDISMAALAAARESLGLDEHMKGDKVSLLHMSFSEPSEALSGFDAAALVETIEHIDPGGLSAVEHVVFGCYRPRLILVTTPNQEYNVLHGVLPGSFRHPDHRFEWCRSRFQSWASGVARRNNYAVSFIDIGEPDPDLGSSTQMAKFIQAAS
jgi:3' terminal RNA ribose 2'-O-methyltransferase Hen1